MGYKSKCGDGVSLIHTMSPAQPGTLALFESKDEDGKVEKWSEAVVAWVVVREYGYDPHSHRRWVDEDIYPVVFDSVERAAMPLHEYIANKSDGVTLTGLEFC